MGNNNFFGGALDSTDLKGLLLPFVKEGNLTGVLDTARGFFEWMGVDITDAVQRDIALGMIRFFVTFTDQAVDKRKDVAEEITLVALAMVAVLEEEIERV